MEDRRRFFRMLGGVSVVAVSCSDPGGQKEATGDIDAGAASALPLGALRAVPGHPLVVGRDAGGIYAMTAICTHAQCDITKDGDVSDQGLHCGCHSSDFDRVGRRLSGPANQPLRHYRVSVSMGRIVVHAGDVVPDADRTAAPA